MLVMACPLFPKGCAPALPPWETAWRSHTRCGRCGVDGPHQGSVCHGRSAALGGPEARREGQGGGQTRALHPRGPRANHREPPCRLGGAIADPTVCAVPDRCSGPARCTHWPGWLRPLVCREAPSEAPPCVETDRRAPRWQGRLTASAIPRGHANMRPGERQGGPDGAPRCPICSRPGLSPGHARAAEDQTDDEPRASEGRHATREPSLQSVPPSLAA
jgi:hypothetical protein